LIGPCFAGFAGLPAVVQPVLILIRGAALDGSLVFATFQGGISESVD